MSQKDQKKGSKIVHAGRDSASFRKKYFAKNKNDDDVPGEGGIFAYSFEEKKWYETFPEYEGCFWFREESAEDLDDPLVNVAISRPHEDLLVTLKILDDAWYWTNGNAVWKLGGTGKWKSTTDDEVEHAVRDNDGCSRSIAHLNSLLTVEDAYFDTRFAMKATMAISGVLAIAGCIIGGLENCGAAQISHLFSYIWLQVFVFFVYALFPSIFIFVDFYCFDGSASRGCMQMAQIFMILLGLLLVIAPCFGVYAILVVEDQDASFCPVSDSIFSLSMVYLVFWSLTAVLCLYVGCKHYCFHAN